MSGKRPERESFTVRLDATMGERIRALQASASTQWHRATASEVLRRAIALGVEVLEQRVRQEGQPGSGASRRS